MEIWCYSCRGEKRDIVGKLMVAIHPENSGKDLAISMFFHQSKVSRKAATGRCLSRGKTCAGRAVLPINTSRFIPLGVSAGGPPRGSPPRTRITDDVARLLLNSRTGALSFTRRSDPLHFRLFRVQSCFFGGEGEMLGLSYRYSRYFRCDRFCLYNPYKQQRPCHWNKQHSQKIR